MTLRLAVFDCDGTLVDGQHSICTAMERAFALHGLPAPDRHAVRRVVGLSLPTALRKLAPEADAELGHALTESYKEAYRAAREAGELSEPLYEGIAELVEGLHADGWLLGVATGKSDRGLSHVLAAHGLTRYFSTLQTADRHPSKPHPAMLEAALAECLAEPHRSVMIGDTGYDMEMARAAGVRAIGVDWGYHTADELRQTGAEAVALDAGHLRELLG
jgi:phosphoglycolate phosphatase